MKVASESTEQSVKQLIKSVLFAKEMQVTTECTGVYQDFPGDACPPAPWLQRPVEKINIPENENRRRETGVSSRPLSPRNLLIWFGLFVFFLAMNPEPGRFLCGSLKQMRLWNP